MVEYPIVVYTRYWSLYMHINKINGKKYVGITSQKPKYRWKKGGKGYVGNEHFWRAINLYGWDGGFDHIILENNLDVIEASHIEQILISAWNLLDEKYGYNINIGGRKTARSGTMAMKNIKQQKLKEKMLNDKKIVRLNDGKVYSDSFEAVADNPDASRTNILEVCRTDYKKKGSRKDKARKWSGMFDNGEKKIWVKYNDYINMTPDEINKRLNTFIPYGRQHEVVCINTGEIFNCCDDANNKYHGGKTSIAHSCANNKNLIVDKNTKISFAGHDSNFIMCAWMNLDDYNNLSNETKSLLLNIRCYFTAPVICLNSLEFFAEKKIVAKLLDKDYTTPISVSAKEKGNKSGFKNPTTGEALHWINYCDYLQLTDIEKQELNNKYYTGNMLIKEGGMNNE